METKAKVKLCKCGAGIPPYSSSAECYECMKSKPADEKLGKLKEIIQKTGTKTVVKQKKNKQKPKRKTKRK